MYNITGYKEPEPEIRALSNILEELNDVYLSGFKKKTSSLRIHNMIVDFYPLFLK